MLMLIVMNMVILMVKLYANRVMAMVMRMVYMLCDFNVASLFKKEETVPHQFQHQRLCTRQAKLESDLILFDKVILVRFSSI